MSYFQIKNTQGRVSQGEGVSGLVLFREAFGAISYVLISDADSRVVVVSDFGDFQGSASSPF